MSSHLKEFKTKIESRLNELGLECDYEEVIKLYTAGVILIEMHVEEIDKQNKNRIRKTKWNSID